MKKFVLLVLIIMLCPFSINAAKGCCSRNGGVCGCTSYGITVCCSGKVSDSPNCTCTPPKVNGCTDPNANNYNPNANKDNGSCKYNVYGCTDKEAKNYNSKANIDDDSCEYDILGCMDNKALNYNYSATKDDGSCKYEISGCTNPKSTNYNKDATKDDGSCDYIRGCTDPMAMNYDENAFIDNYTCEYETFEFENKEDDADNIENNVSDNNLDNGKDEVTTDNTKTEIDDNKDTEKEDTSSPADTLVPITVLGGGGYYAYKKIKGKKK